MDLDFTSEQEMLRKSVVEFLSKECPFEHVKELEESEDGYSQKIWKKMAELGWMELYFPEEYEGLGDPFINVTLIMEEMGRAAFPSPYFSTVVVCGLILLEGGSEKQKKDLLPKIASGKLIMALAQYEQEAGYAETGINMPATPSGDNYVLNGTKMFVMDANVANKMIVAANVENAGTTLFLVDAKDKGIAIRKIPTIGKDNTCEVVFDNVSVSKDNIIGKPGDGWEVLEKMGNKAIVAKCAEMLGGCKESIDMTAAYAKQRVQYSTPIGAFQAIQHYMANMKLAYDTSINYLHLAAWMADKGTLTGLESSTLKAQVNEQYKFITERSVQIHGGIGTTREFDIGLFYRRAKAFEYVLGDTQHHYERIAEALDI
ncbi:MAG: acyl-CoA/acyl-ACP dehydrogenase [Deltaproteobacteria bacterium]|nr:acyl-CoA/acyl-ACP dehydrogenase [Deltaproteobacteria bacterium]MBW1813322.1 acyl-CoA/acyl-ACP dehydrogenase [Deltaproteobacteria bacterium]MBW1846564.1 acyl-CoA/acyl-ACP dehydrogenase [Deltaproteobacteria bacterium]